MTQPATIRIDRLTVRLPHELGPRARAIAPLIARRIAEADWPQSRRADTVRIPAVPVHSGWSDAAVAGAVARATAARINARKG